MLVFPEPPTYSVDAASFLQQLSSQLAPSIVTRLESKAAGGRLKGSDLEEAGLGARFSEPTLELFVTVPPELRNSNVIYLSQRGESPNVQGALDPNLLSGFVNAFAAQDFGAGNLDPAQNGRRPIRTDLDGALNFNRWVLEGNGRYNADSPASRWSRGDTRLVRDFPNAMVRAAVGDLSYPVAGYQRFKPLGGVTVASNFTLQPYRVTVPISSTEIVLKAPSKVVVNVNGYRVQTLFLPAGRHDLRSLALGNGISDVRLEITDDLGRTEIVTIPWISDSELLAQGIHQFAYSFGFPSTQAGATRRYDRDRPTAALFHRYGVSSHATLGAFYEGDKRQLVGGLEALYSTLFGTFGLEPAISRVSQSKPAAAARLRYSLTDYRGPSNSQRNLLLGVEYRGRSFTLFDETTASGSQAYDLSASYSQNLFYAISGRVSFDYLINRHVIPGLYNSYTTALSLIRGWESGFQISLTGTDRRNLNGVKERGVYALLTWAIPGTNHYLTASTDTIRESNRVDWRYASPRLVGGYTASAGVEKIQELTRADASAEYNGNRGSLGLTHLTQVDPRTRATHATSLRASTALAFAGGTFALRRPITDSFAIIAPHENLKGQTIEVNPNSYQYYDARADWLGPGLISTMRSYQYYHLHFDPSRLDPGYELGRENYDLLPSYKSGTRVEVGTESTIMLGGVLVGPDGKPIALEAGQARHLGDPDFAPITLFSNRRGKFRMEGFKPGQYELSLFNDRYGPVRFEVPKGKTGLYDIGGLKIPGAK